MLRVLLVASTILVSSTAVLAQGSVEHGRELAVKHCARCHDISPNGKFKTYPPSFASIAVFRAQDQIMGRIKMPALHSRMPQMDWILSLEGVDNLVAYIMSLEKPLE